MTTLTKSQRAAKILTEEYYLHPVTGSIQEASDWIADANDWDEDEDNTIEEQAESLLPRSEGELLEMYDEHIDSLDSEVELWGRKWMASTVLKQMNPTAYLCEFANYIDSLR